MKKTQRDIQVAERTEWKSQSPIWQTWKYTEVRAIEDFKVVITTKLMKEVKKNTLEMNGKLCFNTDKETTKRTKYKFKKWKYNIWNQIINSRVEIRHEALELKI
jgi:hypothetical protein